MEILLFKTCFEDNFEVGDAESEDYEELEEELDENEIENLPECVPGKK